MPEEKINPPAAPEATLDNAEFKKKIEESKQVISEANFQAPKRGRGRPRKNPNAGPQPATHHAQAAEASASPAAAPMPAPDISQFVKPPLMAISKVPAIKYRIPELALTDDEAQSCAAALNQVVQAFVPDVGNMDPKTAAVIMAFSTFGGVGFQKYLIFREKQKMSPQKPAADEVQTENKAAQENSGIGAENYFSRQSVAAAPL